MKLLLEVQTIPKIFKGMHLMTIVNRVANIKWTELNRNKFEEFGYKFTGIGEEFEVAEQHTNGLNINLKEKLYPVKLNSANKKHITQLGFQWTRVGDIIFVKSNELTKSSHTTVMCICDLCNVLTHPDFKDYYKITEGGTKQQKCSKCGNSARKDKSVYIKELFQKHNNIVLLGEYLGAHVNTLHKHVLCNHEWSPCPHDILKGQGCPKCNGTSYIDEENSFLSTYPHLESEWDYEKNKFGPGEIRPFSNEKVWWKCPNDETHSYDLIVSKRTMEERGCPYCSGRKVHPSNCLAKTHPHLIQFWDYEKNNLTPNDVTYGSKQEVHWIGECSHEWIMPVKRVTREEWCPICCESKGERYIRGYLESIHINFISQKKYNDLKHESHLKYDFCIKSNIEDILIEYHGEQHFHFHPFFHRDENGFKEQLKRDEIKREYARANKKYLIIIPFKLNGKLYNREETIQYLIKQLENISLIKNGIEAIFYINETYLQLLSASESLIGHQ